MRWMWMAEWIQPRVGQQKTKHGQGQDNRRLSIGRAGQEGTKHGGGLSMGRAGRQGTTHGQGQGNMGLSMGDGKGMQNSSKIRAWRDRSRCKREAWVGPQRMGWMGGCAVGVLWH